MRDFFKLKAWFIFLGIAITAVSFSAVLVYRDFLVSEFNLQRDNLISRNIGNINYALAGSADNVSGFAWSENIGWISFNSTNCDSDCSGATCTSDGSPAGCPAIGTTYSNYGVKIDGITGNFSGYAWSSNVGWISFNRTDTANPPSNDPGGGSGPIAVLNLASEGISGWAKILSLGDDGWIRFDHGQPNPVTVDLDGSNGGNSGDFYGWAYNEGSGGGGIGWLSFNSLNPGAGVGSAYKVSVDASILNQPPSVSFDMPADAITYDDLCINPLTAYLRWTFHDAEDGDGNQTNCDVQIKKSTDAWTTLAVNYVGINHTGEQYAFDTNIDFNTAYNWRVKVYDSVGLDSGWVEFNDTADSDGDGANGTFTTYKNDFPDPYFTWTPHEFSADEDVKFIDGSTCYDGGSNCSNIDWEFSGTPPSFSGNYYNASNTIASFPTAGEWSATSTVTDSNGYSCSTTTKSKANLKLPGWIESR